ncbi:MAG: hypothetical protein IKB98_01485 [Clostridia bacterium]|nr:hypothetical protein [Clostridia bacterium]
MSKKEKDLIKINSIIEADRGKALDKFNELFLYDLERILKEYFEQFTSPNIKITRVRDGLKMDISFLANSLKTISAIY